MPVPTLVSPGARLSGIQPGSGTSLAFASDWGFDVGSTDTIVRDNNKWNIYNNYSSANLLSVVAATGLDFPSTNVLRLNFNLQQSGDVRIWEKWALPAGTGDGIYHRIYFRNAIDDSFGTQSTGSVHQLEPSSGNNVPWGLKMGTNGAGGFDTIWFLADASPVNWNLNATLSKNTTYRIEWAFVRKANGFFTPLIRIYNSSDTLLYDTSDFVDDSLNTLLDANPDVDLSQTSDSGRVFGREMFVGNNGPDGWTVTTGNYQYMGGYAASVTDWCGPYTPGEAD